MAHCQSFSNEMVYTEFLKQIFKETFNCLRLMVNFRRNQEELQGYILFNQCPFILTVGFNHAAIHMNYVFNERLNINWRSK